MKKRLIISLSIFLVVLFGVISFVYFGLAAYYKEGFSAGTWLNGVYCTGKSIQTVNEELLHNYQYDDITITDNEGREETLSFENMEMKADFTFSLQTLLSNQNPYLWMENFGANVQKEIEPRIFVDEERLREAVAELECIKAAIPNEKRQFEIEKAEEGYRLKNEMKDAIMPEVVYEKVLEAVNTGKKKLNLKEAGCYEDLTLSVEMLELNQIWEKVNNFQQCGISYQFGDKLEEVDASVAANWITLDENHQFVFDVNGELVLYEEGIEDYIKWLAQKYDTYGTTRTFQTTRGDVVTIEGGIYGNKLNQKAEVAYLKEAFTKGVREVRIPEYEKKALYQGSDDIGPTYIEIDLGNQKMYYYIEKTLYVEAPIVTGDMMRKRSTPAAVCFVNAKQKNRVLRGPGYASFVNFWMPVKGGIGIHDAPWRKEFGGEIFKKNGSHGCINTPYEEMVKIFERAEVGTPVIMYY